MYSLWYLQPKFRVIGKKKDKKESWYTENPTDTFLQKKKKNKPKYKTPGNTVADPWYIWLKSEQSLGCTISAEQLPELAFGLLVWKNYASFPCSTPGGVLVERHAGSTKLY